MSNAGGPGKCGEMSTGIRDCLVSGGAGGGGEAAAFQRRQHEALEALAPIGYVRGAYNHNFSQHGYGVQMA